MVVQTISQFAVKWRKHDRITLKNKLVYECPFEKIHIIHLDDLSPGFGRHIMIKNEMALSNEVF